jgi:hypothetical protein
MMGSEVRIPLRHRRSKAHFWQVANRLLIKPGPMSASVQNDRIAAPQKNDAMCQSRANALQQARWLFDHLVGAGE